MNLIKNQSELENKIFFPVGVSKRSTITREDGSSDTFEGLEIYNKNTGKHLFKGSKKYGLLTHRAFVDQLESRLAERGFKDWQWGPDVTHQDASKVAYREFFCDRNGGHIKVRYFMPSANPSANNVGQRAKDTLGYCLVGHNSIDGVRSEELRMGAYRFVCSNGMIGFSDSVSLSKRHTAKSFGDSDPDLTNNEVKVVSNQFETLRDNYESDLDIYRSMDSVTISKEELQSIVDKLPVGKRDSQRQRKDNHFDGITDRFWNSSFDDRRTGRNEFTLWEVYNATTEYITHVVEKEKNQIDNAQRLNERVNPFFLNLSNKLKKGIKVSEALVA